MVSVKKKILCLLCAWAVLIGNFVSIAQVKADSTLWYDSEFLFRSVYDIDSALVDDELTDFPVLVYLNGSVVDWSRVQDDLDDLRFVSSSNVLLSHEVDNYTVNSEAWLWVKIPVVSNVSDTRFFMYYGSVTAVSVEDKEAVWSNGFGGVWHMNDVNSSAVGDSLGVNDGLKKGVGLPLEESGFLGCCQSFDGSAFVNLSDSLCPVGAFTVETWFKTEQSGDVSDCLLVQDVTGYDYIHGYNNGLIFYVVTASGATSCNPVLNGQFDDGEWHCLVSVYDSSLGSARLKVYFDGELKKSSDGYAENVRVSSDDLIVGGRYNSLDDGLPAEIDYLTLSFVGRSEAWVVASYYSQVNGLLGLVGVEGFLEQDFVPVSVGVGFVGGLVVCFFVVCLGVIVIYLKRGR